ncbi:hypothetical protein NDU88_000374 [Pleurodeles waltl]|uniref:Uncharacterized protein n=1 Tax=Pleurodeles waltl TaxID=8319 RepID=A0AAV7S6S8_PLEWA|nr:hypothetical protein NDU88_000374 [Pleurodeles waltl]
MDRAPQYQSHRSRNPLVVPQSLLPSEASSAVNSLSSGIKEYPLFPEHVARSTSQIETQINAPESLLNAQQIKQECGSGEDEVGPAQATEVIGDLPPTSLEVITMAGPPQTAQQISSRSELEERFEFLNENTLDTILAEIRHLKSTQAQEINLIHERLTKIAGTLT